MALEGKMMDLRRASPLWAASFAGRRMLRPTRRLAFGLAISLTALLDVASAWLVRQRHEAAIAVTMPEVTPVMLETRWGSPYFTLTPSKVADGSVEFNFSKSPEAGDSGGSTTDGGGSSGGSGGIGGGGTATAPWKSDTPGACAAAGVSVKKVEAGVFHTVVAVEDPAQCQEACRNDQRCRAAVHDAQRKTCELVEGLTRLTSVSGSTVVLPNCDFSCFKEGSKPNGSGEDGGETPSPQICQAVCQGDSKCAAFSWNSGNKKCTLYRSTGATAADELAVWGSRDSCTQNTKPSDYAGSCVEEGLTASMTANLRAFWCESHEKCRDTCYKEARCQWSTYNRNTKVCYLKEIRADVVKSVSYDLTSPKLCNSSCFRKDSAPVGKVVAVVSNMKNSHYCHYECWMNADCQFWHWEGEASKKCNLLRITAGLISQFAKGHWSGSRGGCDNESAYIGEPHQARGGILKYYSSLADWYATVESVKDLEECLWWCEYDVRCVLFYYDVDKKSCHLSDFISDVRPDSGGAVAYIGTKSPSTACLKVDFRLEGKAMKGDTRIAGTAAFCQAECRLHTECKSFVWDESEHKCVFLTTDSLTSGKTTRGYVSGPKQQCYERKFERPYSFYKPQDPGGGCADGNTMTTVGAYREFAATDVPPCLVACSQEYPKCEVYTWNRSASRCGLHPSIGDGPVAKSGNYVGPAFCDSSCFYSNYGYAGKPLNTKFSNAFGTPHECHLKCRLHDDCYAWTYDSKQKTCALFDELDSLVLKSTPNTWSGRWGFCRLRDGSTSGCMNAELSSTGTPDMHQVKNLTGLEDCIIHCRKRKRCVAVTYNLRSRTCFLKDKIIEFSGRTYDFGDRTAPRECRDDCFIKDVRFTGPLLETVPNPYSAQMCVAMCVARKGKCGVWSYEKATKKCELRSRDALDAEILRGPKGGNGWVSGHSHFCY